VRPLKESDDGFWSRIVVVLDVKITSRFEAVVKSYMFRILNV
jgi:hypothetical protein